MNTLKTKNLKKCLSLLREFMDEAPLTDKKKIAVLALHQLQKITAGTDDSGPAMATSVCSSRPRIYGIY